MSRAFDRGAYDVDAFDVEFWDAVAGDAETWTARTKDSETWTTKSIGVQLWGSSSDAPIILSVSPESGASGTLLTIIGHNFTSVTSVTIDDLEASFTIVDDSTILATVP